MINGKGRPAGYWVRLCPSALRTFFSISFTHVPAHVIGEGIEVALPPCFESGEPPFNTSAVLVFALAMIITEPVYGSLHFIAASQTMSARFLCVWHFAASNFGRRYYSSTVLETLRREKSASTVSGFLNELNGCCAAKFVQSVP
ncbi:MAG: hypothetical protein AAB427_05685 [Chloroflexota bacterium]